MSDLDEQRKKRPGNRDRIDQIKTEMSREVLRDRIAAALRNMTGDLTYEALADAVIRELGLQKQTLNRHMWAAAPNVRRYITEWEADDD
jgi:hypothetical protein